MAAVLMAGAAGANAALLDGKSVMVDWWFPAVGSLVETNTVVVGAGVEVAPSLGGFGIDLSDNNIRFATPGATSYSSGTFNGYQFSDVNGTIDDITSVTIDGITNMVGFDLSRVTFDANNIFVNFESLPMDSQTIVSLTVNGGGRVPEPGTLALLGLGLAGLAGLRSRRA